MQININTINPSRRSNLSITNNDKIRSAQLQIFAITQKAKSYLTRRKTFSFGSIARISHPDARTLLDAKQHAIHTRKIVLTSTLFDVIGLLLISGYFVWIFFPQCSVNNILPTVWMKDIVWEESRHRIYASYKFVMIALLFHSQCWRSVMGFPESRLFQIYWILPTWLIISLLTNHPRPNKFHFRCLTLSRNSIFYIELNFFTRAFLLAAQYFSTHQTFVKHFQMYRKVSSLVLFAFHLLRFFLFFFFSQSTVPTSEM